MCQSQSDLFIYWATSSDMELRLKFIFPLGGAIYGWPHLPVSTQTEAIPLLWTQSDGFVACPYIQWYWNGSVSYCLTALSWGYFVQGSTAQVLFLFVYKSLCTEERKRKRKREQDNIEHKIMRLEHWSTSKKQKIRQRTTLWRHPLFPLFHSFTVWLL